MKTKRIVSTVLLFLMVMTQVACAMEDTSIEDSLESTSVTTVETTSEETTTETSVEETVETTEAAEDILVELSKDNVHVRIRASEFTNDYYDGEVYPGNTHNVQYYLNGTERYGFYYEIVDKSYDEVVQSCYDSADFDSVTVFTSGTYECSNGDEIFYESSNSFFEFQPGDFVSISTVLFCYPIDDGHCLKLLVQDTEAGADPVQLDPMDYIELADSSNLEITID